MISGLACWDVGLVTAALDLSLWSWAFGPASFSTSNYDCFWTCMCSIGLVIMELGLRTSFILNIKLWLFPDLYVRTLDLSPQHWTCHYEAGPLAQLHSSYQITVISGCHRSVGLVVMKLGLRPSVILNIKLWLFPDFHLRTLGLSTQHWTCHYEAGPSAQLHS